VSEYLLVAELSRLGRNMLETLNVINTLSDRGIRITFIRQPELSTSGTHGKLLLAIYSYFAESKRLHLPPDEARACRSQAFCIEYKLYSAGTTGFVT
jgi:hypothetical protein